MKLLRHTTLLLILSIRLSAQVSPYKNNKALTYNETMAYFKQAAVRSEWITLTEGGLTDCGKPLHLVIISKNGEADPVKLKGQGKLIVFVNNAIHAGEPDGTDACVELTEQIISGKFNLPEKIVLAILPVYNIDGSLKRSCCTRANQNGPEEYGFRANGQYLDLNRDFIKLDSRNAVSFSALYRQWDPDIFIDTHVSNGADYQYTMTLITSQVNKLHPAVAAVMQDQLEPGLYRNMKAAGFPMVPYVNVWGTSPDKGYEGFDDSPRYASGYSALFNAFPFVTETHMLKPFSARVEATNAFLKSAIVNAEACREPILAAREKARTEIKFQKQFPLIWINDTSEADSITFMGYEAIYPESKVTGKPQLRYERSRPYTKKIPFYNTFSPAVSVTSPVAYILPQAWSEVIDRMKLNGVEMEKLLSDTILQVTQYRIEDYRTVKTPYEGHYLHSKTQVSKLERKVRFHKGDILIRTNQTCNRYIVETLEPQAPDSWFAWGFFDAILQFKEGISDYVWEPQAEKILADNPQLRKEFESKKAAEPAFASSPYDMLNWIYRHSEWSEPDAFIYPVGRLE